MLLRKNWSLLLMLLLSSIVFSCATVPNVPICKEITPDRGYCSYTLEPGGFFVDDENPYAFNPKKPDEKSTWWEIRPTMLDVPAHSWAELKKFIIKQCRSAKCRRGVGQWMGKLENQRRNKNEEQDWNEPQFQDEIRDLLHGLTAPSEQGSGKRACPGN